MGRKGIATLLLVIGAMTISGIVEAGYISYSLISLNPSFEDEFGGGTLAGWNYRGGLIPTIVNRPADTNTTSQLEADFEFQAGKKMVRLDGKGGFGQFLEIKPETKNLLMNVMAYAQRISGTGSPFAIAQVTLYDATWKELSVTRINIGAKRTTNASGLVPNTYGIFTPTGTKYALLAIWSSDAGVRVFVDGLSLSDLTPTNDVFTTSPYEQFFAPNRPNLIINPSPFGSFNNPPTFSQGPIGFRMWAEFWNSSVDYRNREYGIEKYGSTQQNEWAYQLVPITSGQAYSFGVNGGSSVGFDFYDANWSPISKTTIPESRVEPPFSTYFSPGYNRYLITPPANTAFASLYFYVPKGQSVTPPSFDLRYVSSYTGADRIDGYFARSGPGRRGGYTWFFYVSIIDNQGIDPASVTSDDFYITSKSNPNNIRTPIIGDGFLTQDDSAKLLSDDGKLLQFPITFGGLSPNDFGDVVLKPNAVFDKAGNSIPPKAWPVPALPQ